MDKKVEIPIEKVGENLPNSVKKIIDRAVRGEEVSSDELKQALVIGGKPILTYLNEQLKKSEELRSQENNTDKNKKGALIERIKRNYKEIEIK